MPFVAADFQEVFEAFGLKPAGTSIYAFNPVFRVNFADQEAVLKRTQSVVNAPRVVKWTQALQAGRVRVVSPLTEPREVAGRVWTLYPLIPGHEYNASLVDIAAAGRLLGQMHALPGNFLAPFQWPDNAQESIQEDVDGLEGLRDNLDLKVIKRLTQWEYAFNDEVYSPLRFANLPFVDASLDFKANNLVYGADGQPTLVDPDNGEHVPRILDLALAALLFHLDLPAPGRVFTPQEWQMFYHGYAQFIDLTKEEKVLWPLALRYILQEWGVWHLIADQEGWRNPAQKSFLIDLAAVELTHLALL